jgi:hypothetical protein
MIDAAYLRRQAELCFAIAALMSDPKDARVARLAGDRYLHRAQNTKQDSHDADEFLADRSIPFESLVDQASGVSMLGGHRVR